MPIYEYQCENCEQRSEALQKMSDPPLTTCDHCGGTLKKLLSAPAFQFKGSGWYVTDYANKSGGDNASDAGKSKSESDGGKSEAAKGDGGKSDTGKSDGGKSDTGKSKTGSDTKSGSSSSGSSSKTSGSSSGS